MTAKSTKSVPADMSFEAALKELEAIVRSLESGAVELEQSIADYTRGTALKEHCMKKLADAKLQVEKLSLDANGNASASPFDTQTA